MKVHHNNLNAEKLLMIIVGGSHEICCEEGIKVGGSIKCVMKMKFDHTKALPPIIRVSKTNLDSNCMALNDKFI